MKSCLLHLASCIYHHEGRHIRRTSWPEGLTWTVQIDMSVEYGDTRSFFMQHMVGIRPRRVSAAPDDVIANNWVIVAEEASRLL